MIYIEEDYAPDVPLSHARIGYDNRVTTATADSALPDFPAASVANPLTYEFWRPMGTSGVLTATFAAGPVDYVGIAAHNMAGGSVHVEVLSNPEPQTGLYVEDGYWVDGYAANSGFVFPPQLPIVFPVDNSPIMLLFRERQAFGVRITVSGSAPAIGVLYAGKALAMQRKVWGGINPINFTRRTTIRPNVSEGGQWLGRSIIRQGSETSVTWRNLSYDWYKSDFDPFVEAARTRPFFFGMKPDKYPEITGYVWTAEDITPSISGTRNYVDVTVGMEGLSIE